MRTARHKEQRQRFGPLLMTAALLLTIHGCGRKAGGASDRVEITIWTGWTGAEEIGFRRVLRRYEQLHPRIRFHSLTGVNNDTKTLRALVAGVPPGCFRSLGLRLSRSLCP